MSGIGKYFRKISGEWELILLSLLIAFVIWFLYRLSVDYISYYEYEVEAETNIEGHAPFATSNETLIVRIKGPGFGILINHLSRGRRSINLELAPELFSPVKGEVDSYRIETEELRDALMDKIGNIYEVEEFETPFLTFDFPSQTYKKVPLIAKCDISFEDQYMAMGEIKLTPDSVTVYGRTEALNDLTEVYTRIISLYDLKKSVQGVVKIENGPNNLRIAEDYATYAVNVVRYVEKEEVVSLDISNLPAGKNVVLVPSQVKVSYRIPFGSGGAGKDITPEFSVNYNDFLSSRSGIVIPKLTHYEGTILSYRLEPQTVEVIITN